MEQTTIAKPRTAHELVGGTAVVRQVVDRFYDLMDNDPDYGELRALHAGDLDPMRKSLTDFLVAWLGGPIDWFIERPGVCLMSAHRDVRITHQAARQWADAMSCAVHETIADKQIAHKMAQALSAMAIGMGGAVTL